MLTLQTRAIIVRQMSTLFDFTAMDKAIQPRGTSRRSSRATSRDAVEELSLDEMLDRVTPDNLHGLLDWGCGVGKEWWGMAEDGEPPGGYDDSGSDVPVSDEQLRIVRSRSEAYRRNPGAAADLDEALARIERGLAETEAGE